MTTKNLNSICVICDNECAHSQSYSFGLVHERCKTKKEPKVYHHQNRDEASEGKWYEPWAGTGWGKPKNLSQIGDDIQSPFKTKHTLDGSEVFVYYTIIRECEQPEEKVRVVTKQEIRDKFCEKINNATYLLVGDFSITGSVMLGNRITFDELFGEKVVVEK